MSTTVKPSADAAAIHNTREAVRSQPGLGNQMCISDRRSIPAGICTTRQYHRPDVAHWSCINI